MFILIVHDSVTECVRQRLTTRLMFLKVTNKTEQLFLRESGDFSRRATEKQPVLFIVFGIFDMFTINNMLSSLINLV